jgi:hypothetical protein
MKNNQPFENDEPIRKLLNEWRVDAALPPRFQEQVWERIARNETKLAPTLWVVVRKWIETMMPRPVFASSYMAMLLLFGVSAGYQQGQTKAEHTISQLQARYVQMVDPYQTPR